MVPDGEKHDGGVYLPEDIVFDMLARLPAKALCQFRCVCKAWRDLISDPAFVAVQKSRDGPYFVGEIHRASPPEVWVVDMDGNVVRVLELVRLPGKDPGSDVLGVLQQATARPNNLICIDGTCTIHDDVLIIDPAAGHACVVGTDTRTHLAMPRFGCATPFGTFKVLCLKEALPCQICKVATIAPGRAEPLTWRQRSAAPPGLTRLNTEKETVNGTVYFMACIVYREKEPLSWSDHIAAFDLESEEWKTAKGPVFGVEDGTTYVILTQLKGTLGVVQCIDSDDHRAIIWLMIDFKKGVWVKDNIILMPTNWRLMKILGALDDGSIIMLVSVWGKVMTMENKFHHRRRDVVVFYNPTIKTFTKFMDKMGFGQLLVLYTGSLLS